MGAAQASGLGDRQEKVEETVAAALFRFQSEFLAEYAAQLLQEHRSELEATDGLLAGVSSKLLQRGATGVSSQPPPLFEGWLTKLGAVRRSWKRRWFVVQGGPDYRVSYFKSPGDRQPKGGLILQGYEVRPDCFKSEKDLCIELYHRSRRCFYVFADTREDYAQWIPILKEVCRSARHELHPDPLCVRAFNVAYGATQMLMEDHTNRPPEVSETDALVELVCDRIDHIVLGDAFLAEQDSSHIKMSRRRFASFTSKKFVVATVLHAVVPTLQSVHDQADYLRHRLKAELRTVWPEFTRAEDEFNERIEELVLPVVQPALNRVVKPAVRRILNVIVPAIADAYVRALAIFYEASLRAVDEIGQRGLGESTHVVSELSRSVGGTLRYRNHPLHCIVDMVEQPICRMFDEGVAAVLEEDGIVVRPDSIADTVLDAIQSVTNQAVSMFEHSISEYRCGTTDLAPSMVALHQRHQQVIDALHYDCHSSMANLIGEITKNMVLAPFLDTVNAPSQDLVSKHLSNRARRQQAQLERLLYERSQDSGFEQPAAGSNESPPSSTLAYVLELTKMTHNKLVSLAAEPIAALAADLSVSPLLSSRGGGKCAICMAKVQAAALKELTTDERETSAAVESGSAASEDAHIDGLGGWGWEGFSPAQINRESSSPTPSTVLAARSTTSATAVTEPEPPSPTPLTMMTPVMMRGVQGFAGDAPADLGSISLTRAEIHSFTAQQQQHRAGSLHHSFTTSPSSSSSTATRGGGAESGAAASGVGSLLRDAQMGLPRRRAAIAPGVVAGPSIQAMSAQWRQGVSLQRQKNKHPRSRGARAAPSSSHRRSGYRGGDLSPTRSRHSDGARSVRSDSRSSYSL